MMGQRGWLGLKHGEARTHDAQALGCVLCREGSAVRLRRPASCDPVHTDSSIVSPLASSAGIALPTLQLLRRLIWWREPRSYSFPRRTYPSRLVVDVPRDDGEGLRRRGAET